MLDDYAPKELALATTIPARWYLDPAMLERERDAVFARTWQPVGHAKTVAEAGTFLAAEIAGEPVVVTRAKDGVLRAFSNVCRHRASIIAEGSGKAAALRCPYHAWTYGLDGRLLGCPEFEGVLDFDKSRVALPQFQVETWGPYVFVNQDPSAPPLAEVYGDIPGEVAKIGCPVDRLEFSERRDYVIGCNWKVYVDNYLEGYHLPAAHPGLFRELDYANYRVEPHRYYSSQISPIRPPQGQEPRQYESEGLSALYYWIFPNFMLNVYPDNLSANIIVPLGHDKTLTIFEWFSYPGAKMRPETVAFSDEIQQEDIRICEWVQKGLHSRTYNTGRFSVKRENGVHHFHLLLDEFLKHENH
ncbi:MAG: Rieske 2Fe-2S domain-containing protein [Acidobacteriia bacterium]|nr:Rieske 2Fe-2S domain-containing protein [Terriglobia bacterium]